MSHRSQCPEPAASYFTSRGATEEPVIHQVFHPQVGWRSWGLNKRLSGRDVRALRRQGYTSVALRAGDHTADFSLRELRP